METLISGITHYKRICYNQLTVILLIVFDLISWTIVLLQGLADGQYSREAEAASTLGILLLQLKRRSVSIDVEPSSARGSTANILPTSERHFQFYSFTYPNTSARIAHTGHYCILNVLCRKKNNCMDVAFPDGLINAGALTIGHWWMKLIATNEKWEENISIL